LDELRLRRAEIAVNMGLLFFVMGYVAPVLYVVFHQVSYILELV